MLNILLEREQISQEEYDFVQNETIFLFHKGFMSQDKFRRLHWNSYKVLEEFWLDVSRDFSERRGLFWKLFTKTYKRIMDNFFYLINEKQRNICTKNWRVIASTILWQQDSF